MGSSGSKQIVDPAQFRPKDPNVKEPQWWGYVDDGRGWTARPKSEYMATTNYNKDLKRQIRRK
jgi:hypothetical protein